LTDLSKEDGFYSVSYSIHKDQIKDYDLSGELQKVMREYPLTAGFDRSIEFDPEVLEELEE
jgi:hypothetical protein